MHSRSVDPLTYMYEVKATITADQLIHTTCLKVKPYILASLACAIMGMDYTQKFGGNLVR